MGKMQVVVSKSQSKEPLSAPEVWRDSCLNTENSMHQLSPYIGKLKSSIARDLVVSYSEPGDLIVEPFCGAGTIALEAALLGRRVFASDVSSYSRILSLAKLRCPETLSDALKSANALLGEAEAIGPGNTDQVPEWVRVFFHSQTLAEVVTFAALCREPGREFFMACLLGILHHQRPGFLSYPSSHLVPYLRQKKFPPQLYPEMYAYRELRPRLLAKIERAYKRGAVLPERNLCRFVQSRIEELSFPGDFDCLITSPPYMNMLDYSRDNRLRLWFIDPKAEIPPEGSASDQKQNFVSAISTMFQKVELHLNSKKHCVVIVGERISRAKSISLSDYICETAAKDAPSLRLTRVIKDDIPDVRRARRHYRGTKTEHILVFRKR